MEHLALEILPREKNGTSQYAWLPENASINITDTSEIFDKGNVWSHDFQLNIPANAHIFGTAGEMHGSRLHEQIDKRKARLWVEGLPLFLGYLRLADEVEVDKDGNVDVTFESGMKTFEEMIEGAKANQVPMMDDVMIGMALWRKRWTAYEFTLSGTVTFSDNKTFEIDGGIKCPPHYNTKIPVTIEGERDTCQQYPRMVFPKGRFRNLDIESGDDIESINCLNTDSPYDKQHPYCNIALCYQQYGYKHIDETGAERLDYTSDPIAQREYEYMPPNRVNSAPNFFVIYWLEALMKHLGIHIDENQMTDVEDMRRLFFVNTRCDYELPPDMGIRTKMPYPKYGWYKFVENYLPEYISTKKRIDIQGSSMPVSNIRAKYNITDVELIEDVSTIPDSAVPTVDNIKVNISSAQAISEYQTENSFLHIAYASSTCFPDADISDVIGMLEKSFGIRLLFDDNYRRVRIVLLRNLFRQSDVQGFQGSIISKEKRENCIRGFRMTFGAGTDNTSFYYKGFADKLPSKKELWIDNSDTHDYSRWKLDALYKNVMKKVSPFDKTCYVTPVNGNAYGVKIDKDAKRYKDLHESLFEFAGYMDAEDGDCTGDSETIEEINTGFTPAIVNDLNMKQERNGIYTQRFALFVDETMRPRRPDLQDLQSGASYNDSDAVYDVDGKLYEKTGNTYNYSNMMADGLVQPGLFHIKSDMPTTLRDMYAKVYSDFVYHIDKTNELRVYATWDIDFDIDAVFNEGPILYLQDNYEPNDNGVSPIETHDWGLTLGILRGSGNDAYVQYSGDSQDGEGNETWEIIPGSNAATHPDTCDDYGKEWDYNGSLHVENSEQAENMIRNLYPSTAESILAERYPVQAQDLRDAGWQVSGDMTRTAHYYYIHMIIKSPTEGNVEIYCTPIVWYATRIPIEHPVLTKQELNSYIVGLWNQYKWDLTAHDTSKLIYAVNPSNWSTLAYLKAIYFGYTTDRDLDNGLGVTDGRFSLKLRAEKLNPKFDPSRPESDENRRYLQIENENLQGRGLMDQFYKEYSYWVRNARIARMTVRMELAQLLGIDKTKRVRVGDITGFIRKIEYQVSNQSGLGLVTLEIMYI